MRNLKPPTINVSQHQKEFRLTLFNTKRSAMIGGVFLILPLLFLSGVIFKYYLQIDFKILLFVYEWIGNLDRQYGDDSILNWIIRLLLILGPLFAIGINFISILHIRYEKANREIIMTFRLKWLNWIIIILCSIIFLIFFAYLILENIN